MALATPICEGRGRPNWGQTGIKWRASLPGIARSGRARAARRAGKVPCGWRRPSRVIRHANALRLLQPRRYSENRQSGVCVAFVACSSVRFVAFAFERTREKRALVMRRSVLVLSVALLLGPASALAQTVAGQQAPVTLGVDVFSTLNPRPPSSMITQPQRLVPGEPVAPTGAERPIGYEAGNIIIYPSVTGGAFYDDNVFARNTNRQGDWAGVVRPELAWRTNNWANARDGRSYFRRETLVSTFTAKISSTPAPRSAARCGRREHPGRHPPAVSARA